MKTEFIMAVRQLAAERNLPKEEVLQELESALVTAFRKDDSFVPGQPISVKLNSSTGDFKVLAEKIVVEAVSDPRREIALDQAQAFKPNIQVGEALEVEVLPKSAGRITAQTAKQVLIQRLRKAEQVSVLEEFQANEGDLLTGIVLRVEPHQVLLDLGRMPGVLPQEEQMASERYRSGQRFRVYVLGVRPSPRGPQVLVSRTHKHLLRRLLELEVPEVHNGRVEVKAIAREAGSRSKVAVAAREEGVDPVGSCVGPRGIRIQSIVKELGGEKIDVIAWHPDPAAFIASALSPAQVLGVEPVAGAKAAVVVVPDAQLSLAIGKEGQNARLAAKLTGWRIDIKSSTVAEAEKPAPVEEIPAPEEAPPLEEVAEMGVEAPAVEAPPEEAPKTIEELLLSAPLVREEKAPLRFAEEIFTAKGEGKKQEKKGKEEKVKPKKARRQVEQVEEEGIEED